MCLRGGRPSKRPPGRVWKPTGCLAWRRRSARTSSSTTRRRRMCGGRRLGWLRTADARCGEGSRCRARWQPSASLALPRISQTGSLAVCLAAAEIGTALRVGVELSERKDMWQVSQKGVTLSLKFSRLEGDNCDVKETPCRGRKRSIITDRSSTRVPGTESEPSSAVREVNGGSASGAEWERQEEELPQSAHPEICQVCHERTTSRLDESCCKRAFQTSLACSVSLIFCIALNVQEAQSPEAEARASLEMLSSQQRAPPQAHHRSEAQDSGQSHSQP